MGFIGRSELLPVLQGLNPGWTGRPGPGGWLPSPDPDIDKLLGQAALVVEKMNQGVSGHGYGMLPFRENRSGLTGPAA